MSLDPGLVGLVLFAALCHATWNALVKTGGDRLAVLTVVMSAPAFLCALTLPFVPLPAVESWPYLVASLIIHLAYYACLIHAYKHGDLSQVYPIARGTAPVLVAAGAWVMAGEALSWLELAGVLIVSAGIISLARRPKGAAPGDGSVHAVVFALMTSLTIGLYSLCDGLGVRASGTPLGYILWLFALEGIGLLPFTLWLRRGRLREAFGPSLKTGIPGGIIASLAYGIVIWAMSLGPMAHIVSLRETSVIIAALIGTLVLKEPFGPRRVAAATVVAAGAVLLQLG